MSMPHPFLTIFQLVLTLTGILTSFCPNCKAIHNRANSIQIIIILMFYDNKRGQK